MDSKPERRSPRGKDGHVTPTTALGARLRELRMGASLTQAGLAQKLSTTASRVSDWELGFHVPTLPALTRYAEVFDTSVSELLRDVL